MLPTTLLALAASLTNPATSSASTDTPLTAELVLTGLQEPVWVGTPRNDPRLFVLERQGRMSVSQNGTTRTTTFLDITSLVGSTFNEQGLLGCAFHPDYGTNGFFYLYYTDPSDCAVLSRWQVSTDPDLADASSETILLTIPQPFVNHNSGCLQFGPSDGYLYVSVGDGGPGNDPNNCHSQDLTDLLGSILRIDVDGGLPYAIPPDNPFVGTSNARGEIWHYGLRNPWRFSIDAGTGDLYIGDVGQSAIEEVNVAPGGASGLNFGWKEMEGTTCFRPHNCAGLLPCANPAYTNPIAELKHFPDPQGARAIIGGHVYRGCAIPDLVGTYFYADIGAGIHSLRYDAQTGTVSEQEDRTAELNRGPSTIDAYGSWGEDAEGELLITDRLHGEVFRIVAEVPPALATTRSDMANPDSLTTSAGQIGSPLSGTCDLSTTGHAMAAFFAFDAPARILLGGGQVLLCTDSTGVGELFTGSGLGPTAGPLATFEVLVPNDPGFCGMRLSIQAVHLFRTVPFALSNARDLTLGG